jgi:hypothetical protein
MLQTQAVLVATAKTAGRTRHVASAQQLPGGMAIMRKLRAFRSHSRRSRCMFFYFVVTKEYSNVDLCSHALVPLHKVPNTLLCSEICLHHPFKNLKHRTNPTIESIQKLQTMVLLKR